MTNWIMIVDDDITNLKVAGHILSKQRMRVTALHSGKAMLAYIQKNGCPDLILLDVMMPGMDGFETLTELRRLEQEMKTEEVPVVFLTSADDPVTERRGFEYGVSDFIRKPFDPDVLCSRIQNIISNIRQIRSLKTEAETDMLTGLLNKSAAIAEMTRRCAESSGCLMMIDLDAFKMVNDIYGHDMGERLLKAFSHILTESVPPESVTGRLGGDEFAAFCSEMLASDAAVQFTARLNHEMLTKARELMGANMEIPLGVSVGAVFVPQYGNDFGTLIQLADKALYSVKQNGKHSCSVYSTESLPNMEDFEDIDLHALSLILGERNVPNVALQLDKDVFPHVYRYIMRYMIRNHNNACRVLFTLSGQGDDYAELCDAFGNHLKAKLRKSDIFMRLRPNCYFLLLTDIREDAIEKVISSIVASWNQTCRSAVQISYESEFIGTAEGHDYASPIQIAVVDDDPANLRIARHILTEGGYRAETFLSGTELLKHIETHTPDLILLDVNMNGMNGFETMSRLQCMERRVSGIPVIFLTADSSAETERTGLSLGAMDFITKPFVPEVLRLRVKHSIDLNRFQRSLSDEVEKKTRENRELFLHAVESLAKAIDAKDMYTKGHSARVAAYSQEIAKRAGYSKQRQNAVYMAGLLHDVGKIGVSNAIINKPDRLTDEEYEQIKRHPAVGAEILSNIPEMPLLAVGARWHHERYKVYPKPWTKFCNHGQIK